MTGSEIAVRTPMQQTLEQITSDGFIAKLKNALPEKVSPQRFVSIAVTAVKQNPALITGEHDSLYNSLVRCAQDGLMPDGREAALVMFGKQIQYMPMIGGLRKRLAEHGFDLTAYVVYENDKFDYQLGDEPWVRHKPAKLGTPRGKAIGAYAVAQDIRTRKKYVDVMDVEQIEQVRAVSRSSKNGPWVQWWDEQARKTVGRRLAKTLPLADNEAVVRILEAVDAEYDLGTSAPSMTEDEANAVASASTSDVPLGDRQQLREEPASDGLSDAQLNRIAELLTQVEPRLANATLKGIYGVGAVEQLSPEEADRYEATLREYVGESEVIEGQVVEEMGQTSFADRVPESARQRKAADA